MKNKHISPKLVNSIFLTPGGLGLERGISKGKLCAPHRTLVKILCKQSENFVEGAVINYKVILSLSMRLQIVANHALSPVLSSLWYLGFTILCNLVSVLIPFLHDTLMHGPLKYMDSGQNFIVYHRRAILHMIKSGNSQSL